MGPNNLPIKEQEQSTKILMSADQDTNIALDTQENKVNTLIKSMMANI